MTSRSLEAMGIPPARFQLAKAQVAEARPAGLGQVEARRRLANMIAAAADRDTPRPRDLGHVLRLGRRRQGHESGHAGLKRIRPDD